MKKEIIIQNAIRRYFEREAWITIHFPGNIYCNRGFPDLMLLRKARACFLEIKRGVQYGVTPGQQVWLRRLQEAGFTAGAVKSLWEAQELMEKEEEKKWHGIEKN